MHWNLLYENMYHWCISFCHFLAFDIGMSKLIISKYVTRVFLKAIFGGVIHKKTILIFITLCRYACLKIFHIFLCIFFLRCCFDRLFVCAQVTLRRSRDVVGEIELLSSYLCKTNEAVGSISRVMTSRPK